MFTGIIEELGAVARVAPLGEATRLTIYGPAVTRDVRQGDSIAVSGVCLTVVEAGDESFTADVMPETVRRTALAALRPGDLVNLERAATVSSRLGGHLVQGHVDGVGLIVARDPGEHWDTVRFSLPAPLARYVVEKGSIAVDGVSLTVAAVDDESFTVGLIPTTSKLTTLGHKEVGAPVHLEVDVIAKYVEKLLQARDAR